MKYIEGNYMNRYNNLKQKVLQLVGDFKSDSKSKSAKAEYGYKDALNDMKNYLNKYE